MFSQISWVAPEEVVQCPCWLCPLATDAVTPLLLRLRRVAVGAPPDTSPSALFLCWNYMLLWANRMAWNCLWFCTIWNVAFAMDLASETSQSEQHSSCILLRLWSDWAGASLLVTLEIFGLRNSLKVLYWKLSSLFLRTLWFTHIYKSRSECSAVFRHGPLKGAMFIQWNWISGASAAVSKRRHQPQQVPLSHCQSFPQTSSGSRILRNNFANWLPPEQFQANQNQF